MKFKNKKLLLFDLDGTLIDSVPDLSLAVNGMLDQMKKPSFPENTIRGWVGNGAQTLVRRALAGNREAVPEPDGEIFEEALNIFLKQYGENLCRATGPYEGVPETLEELYRKGYTMAVVTNKPSAFVLPILERLELADFFNLTVGGDDLPRKKPDPLPLLHSCEKLGVPIQQTVMIGDSSNDILAAKLANIISIGVRYGYNYDTPIESFGPDAVVDHFAEIMEILEG